MFKKIVFLFLLLPLLAKAQFNLSSDTLFACYQGQTLNVSTLPEGLEYVDLANNTFDTIFAVVDDIHTGVIPIGFGFEFYGTTYNDVTISTNGYVSFNLANAGTFSTWAINSNIPNAANTDAENSIMSPYTDSQPGPSSNMIYGTAGVAPNRIFIVLWNDFEMFSCTSLCYSSSLVLIEGSNKIINSISNFDSSCAWNGGAGVQGLWKDATTSLIVNDPISGLPRNQADNWTASNETIEYTPIDANTYSYVFHNGYSNFFQPSWFNSAGVLLGDKYILDYIVPNVADLPDTITVRTMLCGEFLTDQIIVETGCVSLEVESLKMESCVNFSDGEMVINGTGACDITDYQFTVINSLGNVVDTKFATSLPVTFSNLTHDIYRVIYSSVLTGCFDTLEVSMPIEYSKPVVHADITHPLCFGESNGNIAFSPHGGFNKEWDVKVLDANGTQVATYNSNDTPINISGLSAGTYTVLVVSPTTCLDTLEYDIVTPPEFKFIIEDFGHNNCGTLSSYINYPVTGGVPPYKYQFDGKYTLDLNRTPLTNELHTLIATDANGCQLIREIEIQDRFEPKVDFSMPLEVNLEDGQVNFEDLTVVNPHTTIESWFWEFGDFGVSYEQNPTHVYKEIGTYKVFLFVTDANGCQSFLEREINVITPAIYLPTAFTPNGDGNNETFKPVIFRISNKDYEMTVSDRWGRLIFKTNNIHEGWDGRDKNGNIMSGSYVWMINYTDEFDYQKRENGLVVLIK